MLNNAIIVLTKNKFASVKIFLSRIDNSSGKILRKLQNVDGKYDRNIVTFCALFLEKKM